MVTKPKLPPGIRLKNGSYEGRFTQKYLDGKQQRLSFYGETVDDVLTQMIEARKDTRARSNLENVSLTQLLDLYLEKIKPEPGIEPARGSGRVKYASYQLRRIAIRKHITPTLVFGKAFGSRIARSIDAEDIDDFLESLRSMGVGSRTLQVAYDVLRLGLRFGLKRRVMRSDVMAQVERPRHRHKRTVQLTREQLKRLLDEADKTALDNAVITLAITTALRQGEILALRWTSIDLKQGKLQVVATLTRREVVECKDGQDMVVMRLGATSPKTEASIRDVLLTATAVEALKRQKSALISAKLYHPDGWVFATKHGKPMDRSNVRTRIFEKLLVRAKCPKVTFHSLRGLAATLLAESGLNVKALQHMLGHTDVRTTLDIYAKDSDLQREQARDTMAKVMSQVQKIRGSKVG